MAQDAYLKLNGVNQGEIKGPVTESGKEDTIRVFAVDQGIHSPGSTVRGGASRRSPKVRFGHLVITKEVDMTSPLMMQALIHGEIINEFELRFWQPIRSGQEFQFYTIELEGARIVRIQLEMLNNRYPENMQHKEREHVSFEYQKIKWTYEDGGITTDYDVEAGR